MFLLLLVRGQPTHTQPATSVTLEKGRRGGGREGGREGPARKTYRQERRRRRRELPSQRALISKAGGFKPFLKPKLRILL